MGLADCLAVASSFIGFGEDVLMLRTQLLIKDKGLPTAYHTCFLGDFKLPYVCS
jgi:hypothetical protein